MKTRLHQCPSGLMLQVTEPEAGVLKAVVMGDEGLVARVEVSGERLGGSAHYVIKLQREGVPEVPVYELRDVLPRVCELMTDYSGSRATSIPPSSDDLRTRLRRLFELMPDRSQSPGA